MKQPLTTSNDASATADLLSGSIVAISINRHICSQAGSSAPIDVGGIRFSSRTRAVGMALASAIACFMQVSLAQSWQTVDDFQYVAGQDAQNYGLAVASNGMLFASGMAGDSTGLYHGLVMASTDAGSTWSTPLDDYLYAPGYQVWYDGGIATDSTGNIYVAGEGYGATDPANHWIIRRSSDCGATWSLVDDFAPGGPQTQPFGLATDSAGNVYVAGFANHVGVNDIVWTVRKGVGGTSFTTVDALLSSQGGQANGIYAHRSAGIFAVGSAMIPGTKGYKATEAWIVRRSSNGGASWTTVDTYQLSQNLNSRAFGVGADASGNIYVVGQGFVKSGKNTYSHWIVRKSFNGGNSWSTVDDFQLTPTTSTGAGRFVADSNGNLYVSGGTPFTPWGANNDWIVRMNPGGTGSWQTADDFQYVSGGAQPYAMAANALGNVFVGGQGWNFGVSHWVVRKH